MIAWLGLVGCGVETKANVVGGPVAVCVAEDRFEKRDRVAEGGSAIGWLELVKDAVAERVEPGFDAVGKWGGTRDQVDGLDGEAGGFYEAAVDGRCRVETGCYCFGVNVEGCKSGLECGADGGDITVAAHLGDEAAPGAEGPVDAGERGLLAGKAGDPVEGGVGEDGVELVIVGERGRVVLLDLKVALACGSEHSGGGVDADDDRSCGCELFGESAVTAA